MSKKTYIVLRSNTLDHDVGDTVELTDAQAAFLSNKIRLKDDVEAEKIDPRSKAAEYKKQISELEEKVASLEVELAKYKEQNTALKQKLVA